MVWGIAPLTILNADESRYLGNNSARRAATVGHCSAGLTMAVHPAEMAPRKGARTRAAR